MKATGIVRKVDELGRVVLPIELRRNLDIKEKDALEIYVDEDKIILKKYESIFILDIRKVEDEGVAFTNEITSYIESLGGKMVSVEAMGRLQFSYEIKKRKAGIYYDYVFELDEAKVIELKQKYRLDERVLRNMVLVYDRPEKISGKVKDLKDIAPQAQETADKAE